MRLRGLQGVRQADLPALDEAHQQNFEPGRGPALIMGKPMRRGLPPLGKSGKLPVGMHLVDWGELERGFGFNDHRRGQLKTLGGICDALANAGCRHVVIGGSFVTDKEKPGDIDILYDPQGVNRALLPAIIDARRTSKKDMEKALGAEVYHADGKATDGRPMLDFLARDNKTGEKKGVLVLDLARLPPSSGRAVGDVALPGSARKRPAAGRAPSPERPS